MDRLTNEQRLQIIEFYYQNSCSVRNVHRALLPFYDRHSRPSETSIRKIVTKFRTKFTLLDIKPPTRLRTVRSQENIAAVSASVTEDREMSIRRRSQQLGLCYSTTRKILRKDLGVMSQRQLLLISSSRVYGFKYLEHAKDQINNLLQKKNINTILFVPYAQRDHNKYTETVSSALSEWGYTVEGLHAKTNPIDAVRSAQAIFIGGGNTFVLLKTLYDKNLVETIRERVLENGVPYIGSSAGTNVATRSIHTTNDMPVVFPPTFDALKLVPFNINPHYLETDPETKHKGETRDERINEFVEYNNLPVLGLREGTSLLVDGDKAILVGDRNATLFKPDKTKIEYPPQSDLSFLL